MIARWLPAPSLSIALFVVWLLLNQSLDAATLLLAAILAIAVPLLTQSLRPARARMRRPAVARRLSGAGAYDLGESALAVLAMIVCLTPGTAWGEISLDRSTLLIHVFDVDDVPAFIELVKTRYERPLMEIFES